MKSLFEKVVYQSANPGKVKEISALKGARYISRNPIAYQETGVYDDKAQTLPAGTVFTITAGYDNGTAYIQCYTEAFRYSNEGTVWLNDIDANCLPLDNKLYNAVTTLIADGSFKIKAL